jgi:hypothetical protein
MSDTPTEPTPEDPEDPTLDTEGMGQDPEDEKEDDG